ncbi:MAG TPA: glycosyltransferase family 2 protein [Candidatus Acidoferrales bacterium]|nr:glycosyltransferase family 2 protein [Candidatus Acidoferrales bacterium]
MTSGKSKDNLSDVSTGIDVRGKSGAARVLVGIPCYNEEVAIGSLVLRAAQYVDKIVVLDDGSTDQTAKVARLAGADVLLHKANVGKGAAIRDLFKYAAQCNFDILVILDGDGQHNPDDIPKLVRPLLLDEADVVNGSRYINGDGSETPLYRRFGQVVLDRFTRLGFSRDVKVTDTQSGFRAFSMQAARVFQFSSDRLAIDSEMLIDAAKAGLRIQEVDVSVRYDVGHSYEHPVAHGLQVLGGVLRNIEFKKPLLAFTAPGFIFIGVGVTLAVYVVRGFYAWGHVPNGPAILMLLFMLVGTFLALTGIILDSMASLTESFGVQR